MTPSAAAGPPNPAPLDTVLVGSRVVLFDDVDSTNERALATGGQGAVFVADRQTQGRGRLGRCWDSRPGLGLWFSVALEGGWPGVAFAAPLAVRDALREALRPVPEAVEPSVKWPNDILLGGRKCCGLLAETRGGRTAVGIGLNVAHREQDFPAEVRDRATSLTRATGRAWDRADLLRMLLHALDRRLLSLRADGLEGLRAEFAQACGVVGRRVCAGPVNGVVEGIDRSGALRVATPAGPATVPFGESVRIEAHPRESVCFSPST
jgi:BirA family biotin operon repressor/biotin-[acetyl-CoA-carboxylase] ligase